MGGIIQEQPVAALEAVEGVASSQFFTPHIQNFFTGMGEWPWRTRFAAALFIRDFHDLPVGSPYDIDLMIDAALQGVFIAEVRRRASDCGLHSIVRQNSDTCFILLSDLDVDSVGRAWAFLEARARIRLAPALTLSAQDIEIVVDPVTGIPVPSLPWQAFLTVVQGVRTGKIDKAEKILRDTGVDANVARGLFRAKLGIDIAFEGELDKNLTTLRRIEGAIICRPPKGDSPGLPMWSRLNRFLLRNFYPYHRGGPLFFTIHGPDGVGKTTTCSEVEKIFARLPLPFSSFHHITGWKHAERAAQKERIRSEGEQPPSQPGVMHRLARWVYRRLPESVQSAYVLATGYNLYLRKLNRTIFDHYCRNRIIFVDRYIYDLATKNVIEGQGWLWIHRIFVRLARRPIRAFILTDQPEAIHRRKQELSLEQIIVYQSIMDELTQRCGVNVEKVAVLGRSPQSVAQIIASSVLDDCSMNLLALLRTCKEGNISKGRIL